MTAGRICSETTEGRMNDKSVMLEASRAVGGGSRVLLNLNDVPSFALFPGQVSINKMFIYL
jgi:DNA polymerase alpha subunit B